MHIGYLNIRNSNRSVLEQSSVVWNASLIKKNLRELEGVQKVAVKLIMGQETKYKESLNIFKLISLKERRDLLSVSFAKKCLHNEKTKNNIQNKLKDTQN